jgi:hypothetical protein
MGMAVVCEGTVYHREYDEGYFLNTYYGVSNIWLEIVKDLVTFDNLCR